MKRTQWISTVLTFLTACACLALPAWALEQETPRITVHTTVQELFEDETLQASGYYLSKNDTECERIRTANADQTLEEYFSAALAQDCADGLNRIIRNQESGVQVTHKVYADWQGDWEPGMENVELYYFPAQQSNGKYVIVVPGNILVRSASVKEGASTAAKLNELGYTVFVLRYRIWTDASNDAPLRDLGAAVQYITRNADALGVEPENYALVGYSSGGQLVGLFCTQELGYSNYGVPRPGALFLGYPINNFFELKPLYHLAMDPLRPETRYYDLNLSDQITSDFPPVYLWYGENDSTYEMVCAPAQGAALGRALEEKQVPCLQRVFQNAPHASATGTGTDAEGWLADAVAFWEEQIQ